MLRTVGLSSGAVFGVILQLGAVQAGILVPIPAYPASTATYVRAINDANVVTGFYYDADGNPHGFVGTLGGAYTSFDASANGTIPLGIDNAGYITGTTNPVSGCEVSGCGFVRAPDGTIETVHKGKHTLDSVVQGNVGRTFVGDYAVDGGAPNVSPSFYGFYGRGSKYVAALTLPFTTTQTRPRGLNAKGTVVGFYSEMGNGTFPGFVLQDDVATSVTYPDPNAWQVYIEGINNAGMAAGSWVDYALTGEHGFLYDTNSSSFSAIKVPHANYVVANGINNNGVVAVSGDGNSYIYCLNRKRCPAAAADAVESPEHWQGASPNDARSLPCVLHCVKPLLR